MFLLLLHHITLLSNVVAKNLYHSKTSSSNSPIFDDGSTPNLAWSVGMLHYYFSSQLVGNLKCNYIGHLAGRDDGRCSKALME